ncbi:hypothetical protein CCAN2_1900018 [Capnocytophaga canimorsus]|nr:hypothetical protein CCAN2_1900018 [Capnocytophaga canimorsus]
MLIFVSICKKNITYFGVYMVKVDRFTKTYFLIDWFVVLKVAFKMLFLNNYLVMICCLCSVSYKI